MVEYRVTELGESLDGASNPRRGSIAAICKRHDAADYFAAASEAICARLAPLIGLETPPGVIARNDEGEAFFASLDFAPGGTLGSTDLLAFVAAEPVLAAGIVVFDCWIGNEDRMQDNLFYDAVSGELVLFDHDQALFGPPGALWIEEPDEPHCDSSLVQVLEDASAIKDWATKVALVPEELLRKACDSIVVSGIYDKKYADAAFDYLASRQPRVHALIKQARWGFLALRNPAAI
jgi:hypothetical protein